MVAGGTAVQFGGERKMEEVRLKGDAEFYLVLNTKSVLLKSGSRC